MNKKLDWLGGIWLLINLPFIPFVGSLFHQLSASVHLALAVVIFTIFVILSRSLSAAVLASLCVVLIALLRFDQVQDLLQSAGIDSVISNVILVIIIWVIVIGLIVFKITKGKIK